MNRILVFILLFSIRASAQSVTYTRNDSIPVTVNGDTLHWPWAGGLNFCQFSSIDLNLDGTDDLFVFDRAGNKVSTWINGGTSGQIDYTFAPEYLDKFPRLNSWAILRDYNCDGLMDIFTYGSGAFGGIDVWENTSTLQNGLQFQLAVHLLQANVNPNSTNQYDEIKVSSVDIPAIRDVDHDGDIDILTFDVGGTTIEWYRNLRVENNLSCDTLDFRLETLCWGEFTENTLNASLTLNTPCSPPPIQNGNNNTVRSYRHAGSCLECINTNGDNDEDLLIGDLTNPHITYVRNGGNSGAALADQVDALYPSYDSTVNMNIFVCGYHLDINNDGKRDVIFSPNAPNTSSNYTSCWLYTNTGADDSVILEFSTDNFLQSEMIETGEGAVPRMFDYDNDGDLDLFIGNYGYYSPSGIYPSKIALYKNIGNATAPSFQFVTDDFAGLYANSYNIIAPIPTFGDIDGDGDKDMIVGDGQGKIHLFRKDPGPATNFVLIGPNYQSIDVGNNAAPQLVDIDRDGLLDLLIGEQTGTINYYRNTGTSSAASYSLTNGFFGGVVVQAPGFITGYSIPQLFDNNGTYVLLVGSERGFTYRFDNIDGNLGGNFTMSDSMYITTRTGMRTAPWMCYLNGDTIPDVLIGNYSGGVSVFTGDIDTYTEEVEQNTPLVQVFPNPATSGFTITPLVQDGSDLTLMIRDITGRIIETRMISGSAYCSTENWSSGLYFIEIIHEKGKSSVHQLIITEPEG